MSSKADPPSLDRHMRFCRVTTNTFCMHAYTVGRCVLCVQGRRWRDGAGRVTAVDECSATTVCCCHSHSCGALAPVCSGHFAILMLCIYNGMKARPHAEAKHVTYLVVCANPLDARHLRVELGLHTGANSVIAISQSTKFQLAVLEQPHTGFRGAKVWESHELCSCRPCASPQANRRLASTTG